MKLRVLLGFAFLSIAFPLIGSGAKNPPAKIAYSELPCESLFVDDPWSIHDSITRMFVTDPFEKTEARTKRLNESPLNGRVVRFIIDGSRVTIQPNPDTDTYVVRMSYMDSPRGDEPPVVSVAKVIDHRETEIMQNGFGVKADVTRVYGRELKFLVTNWSKLEWGLIWQDPEKVAPSLSHLCLGVPFFKPSDKIIDLMKQNKLHLMLRLRMNTVIASRIEATDHVATISDPYGIRNDVVSIPAELEALAVLSQDNKTMYALWSNVQMPTPTPTVK